MNFPIVLYHKIDRPTADIKIGGAFTSPKCFAKQLSYLKRNGFVFYTVSELVGSYLANGVFPKNAVCLTFDDGWKDNYTNAFPILKHFNAKATIFLVPSCIGLRTDHVTAEGEGPREHLSENDIREMSAFGIEFGSHSMSHKLFDRITAAEIEFEVKESKKYIENLLQKDCGVFAYPAGFFNDFAKTAVKEAGYAAAFTTTYGSENSTDTYEVNRLEILRRDRLPFRFQRKVKMLISHSTR